MTTRYEIAHDDDDDTWNVIAYHDNSHFEAWGSFDNEMEAIASMIEHQKVRGLH